MKNINRFKLTGLLISGLIILTSCAIPSIERFTPLPPLESQVEQSNINTDKPDSFSSDEGLIDLYESVNPGIAAIIVYNDGQVVGQGSGFLFDDLGHVITNYHVVENAVQIEVVFPGGFNGYGEIIGSDLDSDIAVIETNVSREDVKPLKLGNSADVKVGQYVVAIGNPYGLSGTMTVGIVSARRRLLDSLRAAPSGGFFTAPDLIQTDAAINPGNSGGPLLNMNGEVIGINRAIRTNEGGDGTLSNSGIGFAIPIDIVKRVIPYLIRDGAYEYPYLGIVSRETLTLLEKETLGFSNEIQGAYVIDVPANGPAADAGMHGGDEDTQILGLPSGGDLIMAVDGEPIRNFSDLLAYLVTYKSPGDEMKITVLRDGQELELIVVLEKRPS
ncbi:MAG: trypsin-like peptidase domain-containing protein [Candidatus Desulfaltia sp.]|nr:trypsin-like peptidase domain-containing protein [Candidatus Desulfaltia sp.]